MTFRTLSSAALACSALLLSIDVRADTNAECAKAYEAVQTLKRDGKLNDARKQALFCGADSCPALLRSDCSKWASQLEEAIPTFSFDAKGPSGATVTDVKVYIDGVLVAEALDGRHVRVDPGSRALRFEHATLPAVEQKVLVYETDRARRFTVRFEERAQRERPIPLVTWVFGGISVAALVGGAYFALSGLGRKGDLDDSACAPRCNPDDVDAMSRDLALGDLLLGAGIVAGGAAAVSFVLRPTVEMGGGSNGRAWIPTLRGTF